LATFIFIIFVYVDCEPSALTTRPGVANLFLK